MSKQPYGSKIKAQREKQEKEVQQILEKIRNPETLARIREVLHERGG